MTRVRLASVSMSVDGMHIAIAPVLLGAGEQLFDDLNQRAGLQMREACGIGAGVAYGVQEGCVMGNAAMLARPGQRMPATLSILLSLYIGA